MIPVVDLAELVEQVEGPIRRAYTEHEGAAETLPSMLRAVSERAFAAAGLPLALVPYPVLAQVNGEPAVLLRYPVRPASAVATAPSLSPIIRPRATT